MSPRPTKHGIRAGATLLAVAVAVAVPSWHAGAEPAAVAAGGTPAGYPNQAPVAGWVKEITARSAKVRTLAASYEYQAFPRGRVQPLIESGTVKLRFGSDPNHPVQERWEGKSDEGRILRIVTDGKVNLKVNDKVTRYSARDAERIGPSLVRFPLLPEACAARFLVWYASEFEPGMSGPVTGRPFPTALGLEPRQGLDVPQRLKQFYVALEPETGLAYKIRWHELTGAHSVIELFDSKTNVTLSDADFAPPAEAAGATAKPAGDVAK
jgi:hypothetical protein